LDSAAKNKGLEEIVLITRTPRLLKTIILFHKYNKQQITFNHSQRLRIHTLGSNNTDLFEIYNANKGA